MAHKPNMFLLISQSFLKSFMKLNHYWKTKRVFPEDSKMLKVACELYTNTIEMACRIIDLKFLASVLTDERNCSSSVKNVKIYGRS